LDAKLESQYTTNNSQVKAIRIEIEAARAELKRLEEAHPRLRALEPAERRISGFTNAPGASAAGDFVEYPVNKTWAELGDMFDLSTPEETVASFGIHALGGDDLADLINKATIGLQTQPHASWKFTYSAQDVAYVPKNMVVEVILYREDMAGAISWLPATNHLITECLARKNGEWKIYCGEDLGFTLTKEAAVRQFEKEAENCRQRILALASQPPPDLASQAGALSNGIVQIAGAFGKAVQQLQGDLLGLPVQQNLSNLWNLPVQQALSAARSGSSGSRGSFTIGPSPFGPATTYEWTKNGTNFTVKTNQ